MTAHAAGRRFEPVTPTRDRLTALDATFLELEEADESAHMHIGGLMVFEPAPELDDGTQAPAAPPVADVCRHLESRLDHLPRFAERLSTPRTGGLHWPRWERDPRFDVAAHMRRERLPAPGGRRELLDWAGEFYSERLDRTRPLWEMVVLEGLWGGRWGLATKTHHCMVDGVGSVDIGHLIMDTERRFADAGPGRDRTVPSPPQGTPASSIAAGSRIVSAPLRLGAWALGGARAALGAARHPGSALRSALAMGDVLVHDEVVAAPHTSLNDPIGGKRHLETCRISLEDVKSIKRSLGGTVNDVVLAAAAGGLRRLLLDRDEPLPEAGVRAMVPMNVRRSDEHNARGNRISSLFVNLPVAVADPLARYDATVEEAEALKSGHQAEGSSAIIDLAAHAPPALHTFLARSLYATRLFNVTITNVPGPQTPLYAFGSELEEIWPLVPLAAEHAVGLAVLSYDGQLFFCLNADRATVPDAERFVVGVEESIAELATNAAIRSGYVGPRR
jgi:WS/DGAT/MGAT family acyltransferase